MTNIEKIGVLFLREESADVAQRGGELAQQQLTTLVQIPVLLRTVEEMRQTVYRFIMLREADGAHLERRKTLIEQNT